MSPDKMIRMANQIAAFFKTQPGDVAADRVAAHIRDFWDPRMRAAIVEYVDEGGDGLDESVRAAVEQLRTEK